MVVGTQQVEPKRMQRGLDGVVAAETVLCLTDAERGMIWVRGVPLPTLLAEHGFEGTVALLWDGFAGEGLTRAKIQHAFGAARVAAFAELDRWMPLARGASLYEGLRLALAIQPDTSTPAALVGAMSVAVAALLRAERGLAPVAPDAGLSSAADLLRMFHGAPAPDSAVAALDTYFTSMVESGLSASSFTARVIASTRASLASAVVGAWGAFTGALHGGAPGPTLDLLEAAEAEPDIEAWIEGKLLRGERLMGFGHRVYSGNDPRAEAMRAAMQRMGELAGRLAFATRVETAVATAIERVKPGRKLPPNVEVMAALLLDAVGFPRSGFTPVFAACRVAGWLAHAMEQQKTGRMIRPTSAYVGPAVT